MTDAELSPSAHVDTFCRDNLPARETWPQFLFEVPEVQYPHRLNVASVLLGDVIDAGGADRRCIGAPVGTWWTYGELR